MEISSIINVISGIIIGGSVVQIYHLRKRMSYLRNHKRYSSPREKALEEVLKTHVNQKIEESDETKKNINNK